MPDPKDSTTQQPPTPTDTHCAAWRVAYGFAFITTAIVGVGLFGDTLPTSDGISVWAGWLLESFILTLLIFLILVGSVNFVRIFSCVLPRDDAQLEKLKWRWMTFAYSFMLFAMFAAVTPFIFDIRPTGVEALKKSPISVLVGCVEPGNRAPRELYCPELPEKSADNDQLPDKNSTGKTGFEMWVLNLGGEVKTCSLSDGSLSCRIQGGLVVPIYLLILALFGGAISLTRRVPEFQKQAADNYVATDNAPKLEPHRLREYLIFQIIQFISAPFIAVVAYYVIEPAAMTTSVALSFAAGFASESILLMIRAVIDKIQPTATRPPSTGSVGGCVTDKEGQPVKGAEVQVLGVEDTPTATTDTTGCFVIKKVPAGTHALLIQHTDTKNSSLEELKIEAGEVTVRKVAL